MDSPLLLTNLRWPDNSLGDMLIAGGRIAHISPCGKTSSEGLNVLDAGRRRVCPGFIDVHIHGAGGVDSLDENNPIPTISKTLAKYGCTGFLVTSVYFPDEDNKHLKYLAKATQQKSFGAKVLGIHLEGPFIAPVKRGMLQENAITLPSEKVLDDIFSLTGDSLRMMTIAPERKGALPIINKLCDRNVIASFAHSDANYEETRAGISEGISHVTHLYNAMRGIHHREPGPIPALLEAGHITAQILCDGQHLDPSILRHTVESFGLERLVVITDGMRSLGLPDGDYQYDGIPYTTKNGTARYKDGTLIGTARGIVDMLFSFMEYTNLPLEEALQTVTSTPAKLLGLDYRKGYLTPGYDADIVILNEDKTVWRTIVEGDVVYEGE